MVKNCCVKDCKTYWYPGTEVTFHLFPFKNEDLMRKWANKVTTKGKIGKYSYICSLHFSNLDYVVSLGGQRTLNKSAVPSYFIIPPSLEMDTYDTPLASDIVTTMQHEHEANVSDGIFQEVDVNVQKKTFLECTVKKFSISNAPNKTLQMNALDKENNSKQVPLITNKRKRPVTEVECQLQRKIKILQQRLKRKEDKLQNMEVVIKVLKEEGYCMDQLEHVLLRRFSGFNMDILKNEMRNDISAKSRRRYEEKIKDFASTVYFYSPKAYTFLCTKLHLPEESTLRKMISVNVCKPGFVDSVFDYLKNETLKSDHVKDVALIVDGMSIRSQLCVDQKDNSLRGYVDYGEAGQEFNIKYDPTELATEMLAFQIVSYSTKFKLPLAHFFIKRINATTQAILINEAIKKLYNVGVTVRSITCDGSTTNFSTLKHLGCNLDVSNNMKPKTFFKHPSNESNIHVILDPCHMLKVCRNALAEKNIESPEGTVSFSYIKSLHDVQEAEGFKLANKLTKNHIFYQNNKMKVSLTVQTISSGVADAIEFLRESGHKTFQGSEGTVKFIRVFDMMFDMFNSRSAYGKGFKSPISMKNIEIWSQKVEECNKYIKSLKLDGKYITVTKRKAFAVGFIVDSYSFYNLASDLFTRISNPLKYFLPYKCSQDHIELYFCCLRSRGGWNNNPNVLQVLWSIRRLLYRNSVTPSVNANCLLDDTDSVPIFEFRSGKRNVIEESQNSSDAEMEKLMLELENVTLSAFQENVLFYITGYIVQQFIKTCTCSHCQNIILAPKIEHGYSKPRLDDYSGFLHFVNRGKLCVPSKVAYDIVQCCERSFKREIGVGFLGNINFQQRINAITLAHFLPKIGTNFNPQHPITETINGFSERHELKIIQFIATKYAKIRLHAYSKTKTLQYLGEKSSMRQGLSKLILYNNV